MEYKNCKKIRELIMDYIDGILEPEKGVILSKHLDGCEECKKYLENMAKIKLYISKIKVKEPVYLEQKIMSKINEYEQNKQKIWDFGFILKPALSYALSVTVILGAISLIYNNLGNKDITIVNLKDMPVIEKSKEVKQQKVENNILSVAKNELKLIENKKVSNNDTKIIQNKIAQNIQFSGIESKQNKIDEPSYSLSKSDSTSVKMAKEQITPSTTNPLLERDKAIVGNNLINPLKNEYAIIKVKVDEPARVKIVLYDKRIKVVSNLIDEQKDPGIYEVKWYGRNSNGEIVSEGVYFVYIQIGNTVVKKNIIVIK